MDPNFQVIKVYPEMRMTAIMNILATFYKDSLPSTHILIKLAGSKNIQGIAYYIFDLIDIVDNTGKSILADNTNGMHFTSPLTDIRTVSLSGGRAKYMAENFKKQMIDITNIRLLTKDDYSFYGYDIKKVDAYSTKVFETEYRKRCAAKTKEVETVSFFNKN